MIARRFASSFLSKMIKIQKLSTSAEIRAMERQSDAALAFASEVIASKARNSNFIFSPASFKSAFLIELSAVSSASERAVKDASNEELIAAYREPGNRLLSFVNGTAKGGPKITAINGLWVEQSLPVSPWLKDFMENVMKVPFTPVDFRSKGKQVRVELNKWVSENTNGLIKDLFPRGSITRFTDQVGGNALYFNGAWDQKFDKDLTGHRPFHLLNGSSVSVPFLSSNTEQYIRACEGFKVLKLPFRQGGDSNHSFSMYFYLPDKKDGLDFLVNKMTSTLGFVEHYMPLSAVEVGNFRIPKFKISSMFEASEFLRGRDPKALYHKACVEIDEEDAEAAAGSSSMPICDRSKMDFVADHPFLFLIREDTTQTILFAGQICDPSNSPAGLISRVVQWFNLSPF